MDKETFVLLMAHNGLNTAAVLLNSSAASMEAIARNSKTDPVTAEHLRALAAHKRELARILSAADAGVSEYLAGHA